MIGNVDSSNSNIDSKLVVLIVIITVLLIIGANNKNSAWYFYPSCNVKMHVL